LGFRVSILYSICAEINPENLKLLEQVKKYFGGVGSISECENMYIYEIASIKALRIVRKHFEEFPLQTSKLVHFQLWCQVMDMIEKEEHLTMEGFLKILAIKAVFPKGLSDNVLKAYPNVVPINKPEFISNTSPLNPYWIVGFVQADGTFGLGYTKQIRMKLGYTCQPQFRIAQHERDLVVLKRIMSTMGCGNIVKPSSGRDVYVISVSNIKDITTKVIPLFDNYPLYGAKYLDYKDFCKGISIIENKGHLTLEGLSQLKTLVYGMNTYRKF
jgi:hypothetical protein